MHEEEKHFFSHGTYSESPDVQPKGFAAKVYSSFSNEDSLFPNEIDMKNQILAIFSIVSFFSILLNGCAEPEETAGESLTGPIAEIQGTWVTGCYFDGSSYVRETLVVSGNNISEKSNYYSNSACTTTTYEVNSTYNNLSIGEKVTFLDGTSGYRATYAVQSSEYTPLSSSQTSNYNATTFCGVSWVINTPIDILGKNCLGSTTPKNSTMFNLYKLMGNNIYLGTPSTIVHPTTVKPVLFVRQ